MTAGKVMAAIKVDMCRQQPTVPQIVAARPTVVDLVRRRRGNARVCLFGVPEPGSTRKLYDEMLVQQHQHMLSRWQFDTKTDRFVGQDHQQEANSADGSSFDTDQAAQNRLQGDDGAAREANGEPNQGPDNRLDAPSEQQQPSASDDQEAVTEEAAAAPTTTCNATESILDSATVSEPSMAASSCLPQQPAASSGGRAKCPKAVGAHQRHVALKPYDKSVRPITGNTKRHIIYNRKGYPVYSLPGIFEHYMFRRRKCYIIL